MHTHTLRTKFTFGDRVRFDSPTQRCSGTGTIFGIIVDRYGHLDYMIEVDGRTSIRPGILEDEIAHLSAD
jgi:hypothetical protein